jgi:alkylresorcinol/alkylpyrone synthase
MSTDSDRQAQAGETAILAVATAVPEHCFEQEEVKRVLGPLLPVPDKRLDAVMALFDHVMVQRRFSVLPLEQLSVPRSLTDTMALYRDSAVRLGRKVAADCLAQAGVSARAVDLIITVSCTGFMIPSLDAYLAQDLDFRPDVRRLPITELGCVAGAAALARAHDFLCGHPDAHVLVVAVELPTLSFQRNDTSTAQLVSTALFGDGAAAVLLTGRSTVPGVSLIDVESHLFPNTLNLLGFDLRDDGLHVVLAKELPEALRATFGAVVDRLLIRAGIGRTDLECWAVHPGGKRILVAIEEALGLDRTCTQPSWDVLREYGNQSSVAVLFVLERWMKQHRPRSGAYGLLGALGPGLSTELCLLRWN